MGNLSSRKERQARHHQPASPTSTTSENPPRSSSPSNPSGPTENDYATYMDYLVGAQSFLDQLMDSGDVGDGYRDAVLAMQQELSRIRRHARLAKGDTETLKLLSEILTATELKCQQAAKALTQPASSSVDVPTESFRRQDAQTLSSLPASSQVPDTSLPSTGELSVTSPSQSLPPAVIQSSSETFVPASSPSVLSVSDSVVVVETSSPLQTEPSSSDTRQDVSDMKSDDRHSESEDLDEDDEQPNRPKKSVVDWAYEIKMSQKGERGPTKLKIDRREIKLLQPVFDFYEKAKSRELTRDFSVIFLGEEGVDRGALTKEFFHLTFEAVTSATYKDCLMFEGQRGHLIPDCRAEHLIKGYRYVGMMIAHAVRNSCHGLPGLSPALQHYLVHGTGPAFIEELSPPITIDDIAETEQRQLLIKLHRGTNLTESEDERLRDWMERSGCRVHLHKGTVELIVQTLLIHYVFSSRIRQIEAIAEGMKMMDFRSFLKDNPTDENIALAFPSPDDVVITAELFMKSVITRGDVIDEQARTFFKQFLDDLSTNRIENRSLADLVKFLSGSPYLPSNIVLCFNGEIIYPIAHACFCELELPTRHQNYEAFRDAMIFSLHHGTGFTMT